MGNPELPVELIVRICYISTSSSQEAYRSLMLTCYAMRDIVRLGCLPLVPVTLHRRNQLKSFNKFVKKPGIASLIRFLWVIPSDARLSDLSAQIISRCNNVLALACPVDVLLQLNLNVLGELKHCTELTIKAQKISWPFGPQSAFCERIQRLHLIGPCQYRSWHNSLPFINVSSLSYSSGHDSAMGKFVHLTSKFRTLKRIAVVTHWQNEVPADALQVLTETLGPEKVKVSVVNRPRRWKEVNIWIDSLHDKDLFWKVKT